MAEFRAQQAAIAEVMHGLFGPPTKCHPELWDRRAYLMLAGLVYERLASRTRAVSTAELVSLARMLAENRRADATTARRTDSTTPPKPERGESSPPDPSRFAELVRQVYGVNLQ
jgi:hypothetical protein